MKIEYKIGDALRPVTQGNKIIVHICNDQGRWGKGFVLALSKRWKTPEAEYRKWFNTRQNFSLGNVQFVKTEKDIWVANLIGQHGITKIAGQPPIRYEAVLEGLNRVGAFAMNSNATVHMPRIGCGLAGGKWENIEPLIHNALINRNIQVTVYDLTLE